MNKITTILAGAVLLFPAVSFAAPFERNLYYGLQNDSGVLALQEFLTDQGVYTGPITGNFFTLTLQAVKRFQTANSIAPVSGYFGVLSRGVANTLLTITAPVEEVGTTTTEPVLTGGTTVPETTVIQDTTTTQTPVVTIQQPVQANFLGTPSKSVVHSGSLNTITFSWGSNVPAESAFYFCARVINGEGQDCYEQQSFTGESQYTYTFTREANTVQFYKITLQNPLGGAEVSVAGQIPQ